MVGWLTYDSRERGPRGWQTEGRRGTPRGTEATRSTTACGVAGPRLGAPPIWAYPRGRSAGGRGPGGPPGQGAPRSRGRGSSARRPGASGRRTSSQKKQPPSSPRAKPRREDATGGREEGGHPVRTVCQLPVAPRSSFYDWPGRAAPPGPGARAPPRAEAGRTRPSFGHIWGARTIRSRPLGPDAGTTPRGVRRRVREPAVRGARPSPTRGRRPGPT